MGAADAKEALASFMMARVLLDTDIIIDVIRGYKPTIQRLERLELTAEITTSVVTCLELIVGCQNKESLRVAMEFVESFQILPVTVISSEMVISLMKRYNLSHGLLEADALIAAIALENALPLLTRNTKDFRFIEALTLASE